MSAHYTITELAREFDITPRAIRFYEDQGLLAPSREGAGGQRRVYSGHDRTRLKLTLRGKRLGFTLTEIRRLLDLYESPTDTVPQLRAFLALIAEHRAVLDRQLEDLTATLEDLSQYEAQCKMLLDGSASSDAAETAKAADAADIAGAADAADAHAANAAGADASDGADAANAARGG
jgi:DNA-binding transcriptional MerR regulator